MSEQSVTDPCDDRGPEKTIDKLAQSIARFTEGHERLDTAVPGLLLFRRREQTEPLSVMYKPSICLVAQGAKRVFLGDDAFEYDPGHYLISSLHLPTVAQVVSASPDHPCLGLMLTLDLREVSRLMVDSNLPAPRSEQPGRGMVIGEITNPLAEAFNRLIALLESEEDIPILGPVIEREILYRLLVGDQGARLRQIASAGSRSNQLGRAIKWLNENFREPLRIDNLASKVGMSTSSFHHHFKTMTALSPLQYQKQLRLHEAKRLMLADEIDASTAAFQVGYESPSQFSREYSRQFGSPPLRDIKTLQQMTV